VPFNIIAISNETVVDGGPQQLRICINARILRAIKRFAFMTAVGSHPGGHFV
jgi:hypothetical protein